MNKFLRIITAVLIPVAASLTSCEKDNDKVPANLYQQYEVLVNDGSASAFANLRTGGPQGERVHIPDGRLVVNTQMMFYQAPETPTELEYTYFATLPANHTKAIFRLKNSSGKTIENTTEFGNIRPAVVADNSLREVTPGETIEIDRGGHYASEIEAYLNGPSTLAKPIKLTVMDKLDFSSPLADITLPDDLTGVYDLILDVVINEPVSSGDGTASGEIKTIVRTHKSIKF